MGIWEEGRDYKEVGASQTKASLGPGSTIKDGDVLVRLVIIPLSTTPGSVTIFDGAGDSGFIVFQGGTVQDIKPLYLDFVMRAKNAAANASGPRWLVSTGANVSVVAVGTFH